MLELTEEERCALAIVVLRTNVQQEKYGAAHQFIWKKVGLSRAYYKQQLVCEESMPTVRARVAFLFLEKKQQNLQGISGFPEETH